VSVIFAHRVYATEAQAFELAPFMLLSGRGDETR
jgi:hypothetical protein